MPEFINFQARAFHNDDSVSADAASRLIVTQLGQTIELYELRDNAQIVCKPELMPNTDYLFRFVLTHGLSKEQNEICRCAVVFDGKWDERFEYDLSHNRFQPLFSKQIFDGGLLRLFEIPIHTRENTDVQLVLMAKNCELRVYPPMDGTLYASLKDCSYEQYMKYISAPANEIPKANMKPENPVDVLMQKLDRFAPPAAQNAQQSGAPVRNKEEEDRQFADYVQEYMKSHDVAMNAADVMQTFSVTERQATKCLRILFERDVLKYDLDTQKYRVKV